jgi:hypothetical protein
MTTESLPLAAHDQTASSSDEDIVPDPKARVPSPEYCDDRRIMLNDQVMLY